MIQELKVTPLYKKHMESSARMCAFAGWNMPVQYEGILAEHMHTREKASIFDISHMGEIIIKGVDAEKDLDNLLTCDIAGLKGSKCRYGFLLNDNGGIIDDMIVFRISVDEFMVVVNAATLIKDSIWIKKNLSNDTDFNDITDTIAKIDLQGPLSIPIMKKCFEDDIPAIVADGKRFSFEKCTLKGMEVLISTTGYTGEKGYELFFDVKHSDKMWDILLKDEDVKPAGLGARDSLRLEKGYSLYGHDISEENSPLEANLMQFVDLGKDFIGKESILEKQEKGYDMQLSGFVCEGRRSPRDHYAVINDGKEVGFVTSGVFSPCLKTGIGLCYIDKKLSKEGQKVVIKKDNVEIAAEIKNPPFI